MSAIGERDAAQDELERCRRAAEETLDQLQWCINYLHRIGKASIALAVAENHRIIRERIREIGR